MAPRRIAVGEMLVPGRESNFEDGRVMNDVDFTATLDAAAWAPLASGQGRGRIYVVEPSGEFEDDPNVTNKKFPGNPTSPTAAASRCAWWANSSTGSAIRGKKLRGMRDGLRALKRQGAAQIED